jgi:hypothetical protein
MADDIKLVVDSSDLQRAVDFLDKMGIQTAKLSTKTQTLQQKFNKYTSEVDRLSKKYKPLYAASKQYESALEEINRAQKLGVLNDQQRSTSISQLNRDFQQGTGIFSAHANMMNKGMNRAGVALQQTGYQVGDFIVQVQSGTNPMVAFSQQATQLVGVLYLLPPATLAAKVGLMGLKVSMGFLIAGLGIAIPLLGALGAAFLRSGKDAKGAKSEIDSLTDSLTSFETAQKAMKLGMSMEEFTLTEQLKQLNQTIDESRTKISDLQTKAGGQTQAASAYAAIGPQENIQESLEDINKLEKLRDRVLARIQVKSDKQLASMKEANDLARIANEFGKDSQQYRSKVLEYEGKKLISLAREGGYNDETIVKLLEQLRIKRELAQAARVNEKVEKAEADFQDRVKQSLQAEYDATIAARKAIADARQTEEEQKAKALDDFNERVRAALAEEYEATIAARQAITEARAKQVEEDLKNEQYYMRAMQASMDELGRGQAERDRKAAAAAREAERQRELEQREKIRAAIQKQNEETQKLKNTSDQLAAPFDTFFMTIVDGTTSAKDAFRSMARDIIQQLYRILVVEKLVQSISGAIQGAMAGPVQGPNLPSADGGGYTGSGPRSGGLDGKGGFMAMLHPRETVIDHTKGQGSGGTVVNQVFNISANTSDDTKRLITQTIAQASPAIINQSVGAVMNQRRRGGAMKSAFG